MADKLTDIDGIGPKTAEDLRESGIDSPEELGDAYRRGDLDGVNTRVRDAARARAVKQYGSVEDPRTGLTVTEDNLSTFQMVEGREVSKIRDSALVTRNNSDLQDATVADLGGMAARGELQSTVGTADEFEEIGGTGRAGPTNRRSKDQYNKNRREQFKRNVFELGLDTASSLTEFERDTLKRANELVGGFRRKALRRGEKTGLTKTEVRESGALEGQEIERDVYANPLDTAAAKQIHEARSPDAKRVDSRRGAPITTNLSTWVDNPSHYDFPGVDTKKKGRDLGSGFGVKDGGVKIEADVGRQDGEFRVRETETDESMGNVASGAGRVLSEPVEVQRIAIGDRLPDPDDVDFDLNPKGPQIDLFK
jgi:hypothetical protein